MTQGSSPTDLIPGETVACPCGHLPAQHDAVATRHCGATLAGALQRTCICPVGPAKVARNYDRR